MFGRRKSRHPREGLVVGREDVVQGTMTAQCVTVDGRVDGTLDVAGTLLVAPTGQVHGTVRATRLLVETGAVVRAACCIGFPDGATLPDVAGAGQGGVLRLTPRSTRRVEGRADARGDARGDARDAGSSSAAGG